MCVYVYVRVCICVVVVESCVRESWREEESTKSIPAHADVLGRAEDTADEEHRVEGTHEEERAGEDEVGGVGVFHRDGAHGRQHCGEHEADPQAAVRPGLGLVVLICVDARVWVKYVGLAGL